MPITIDRIVAALVWLRGLLNEPSTWAGISGAVVAAAAVPEPVNYAVFALSLFAIVLRETKKAPADAE